MATPFERVKTAWESSDREGELNRVVETMAAEGVWYAMNSIPRWGFCSMKCVPVMPTTKQKRSLTTSVIGFTAGVMRNGTSKRNLRFFPQRTKLKSCHDGRVLRSLRGVRDRVLPLFRTYSLDAKEEHIKIVSQAVEIAEEAGRQASPVTSITTIVRQVHAIVGHVGFYTQLPSSLCCSRCCLCN